MRANACKKIISVLWNLRSQSPDASGIRVSEEVSGETTTPVPQTESAFSTKQSASWSLNKAPDHLPQNPRKEMEIIQGLASKYQIRIKDAQKLCDCPRKELSEEKKDWMIEFLSRSDMTYTNLGRQDNVYIGKVNGERKYLPRQYLLWTLKDLLDIINGSELHSFNFVSTFVSTPDKHVTVVMLQKYISDPFEEATETFKESAVSFKRRIYSKRSQNHDYNHVKGINVLKKSMKQSMTKSTFGLMDAPHNFAPALRSIS